MTVMTIDKWSSNGALIADVAKLGYIDMSKPVRDFTYGLGNFWTVIKPALLVASDYDINKSPLGYSVDARMPDDSDRYYATVVVDPPYKLNGTPDPALDYAYGVHERATVDDRLDLIYEMVLGASSTVAVNGYLLIKVQDQICSGKPVWQTDMVHTALTDPETVMYHTDEEGWVFPEFKKMEVFQYMSYRPQPAGRAQVHARRNASQLMVYRRVR